MTRSMTAFARQEGRLGSGAATIEIHSVNRKNLEMALFLPRNYLSFDLPLRKLITSYVKRGQITLRLMFDEDLSLNRLEETVSALKDIKTFWSNVQAKLGLKDELKLEFFLSEYKQLGLETKIDEAELVALCTKGLEKFIEMKEVEGKALEKDLVARLAAIEQSLDQIEKLAPDALEKQNIKLKEKFEKLTDDLDERILREVALFADKVDITEEIVRFRSHIEQFKSYLLKDRGESIGKTLDFIAQEMLREASTMGAKSPGSEVVSLVIELKSEIEKIKEQVQNIE